LSKGSQSSRHKRILASLIVTLIVVTILLFPAPVRAITITVEGLKGQEITQGETFTFTINMKIESGERVPINKLRITVEGPTSFTYLFSPMGGEQYFLRLETPQSIIDGTAYGYGYGYGYGRFYGYGYGYFPATPPYGYGYGYYPTGYGYGYGYGYGFYGPQTLRWTAVLIHTENLPIGEYKLRVEIQSDGAWWGGIPTEVTFTITAPPVNAPPVADAGPDQWVYVNHMISFDGSASYDPDGFIVSYEWNFGDGKTGVGMIVEHNYTQSGVYVVTLTVRDNDGATDTDVAAVTVESLPLPPEKEVVVVVPEGQTGYVVDASEEANVTITLNSTASTTVTVVKYPDNPHPEAPPPVDNIPKYVDFVISNPEAVTWPIYVEISYTDAEVAGLDESSLGMYYWNEAEGGWRRCSNTGVDTVRNVVWAWMTKEEAVGVKITVGGLALPDLKPTSIEIIPSEPVAGEEVEVDVTIENIGTADAGQFDVTFEVDNVAIQTLSVEGLAVNGTVTLTFTWTPSEPGVYSLTAIVDAEGVVDEVNEDNNILTETVKVGPLVDLTVQFINLPERFIAGEEVLVEL